MRKLLGFLIYAASCLLGGFSLLILANSLLGYAPLSHGFISLLTLNLGFLGIYLGIKVGDK